jgi:hypothetical protein
MRRLLACLLAAAAVFRELREGGAESCATFRFAHVWRQVDSRWQLARVPSFDH